ncbi:hypothetical protein EYF80_017333 [Liparis tanakae]|uniref:Uncharacterized protein n=1 Tax=Liparis tanakae TaxID=230148 RepID=A0A4Z2I348_9TELE|nr:hypothetical protein EYF80_017333 [Liparis tanakae]
MPKLQDSQVSYYASLAASLIGLGLIQGIMKYGGACQQIPQFIYNGSRDVLAAVLDRLGKRVSNSPACPGTCPSERNGDPDDMDGEFRPRRAAQILITLLDDASLRMDLGRMVGSRHRLQMHRVTRSPHPAPPGHLVPLEQAPFGHCTRLQDTALPRGLQTEFHSYRSHLVANSELSGAQDRAYGNIKEPKRCSCSESAHMQDE